MNSEQFREIAKGLESPFWKWLQEHFVERANEITKDAILVIPETLRDMNQREQNFGAGKALTELLENIPTTLKLKLKDLETQENK